MHWMPVLQSICVSGVLGDLGGGAAADAGRLSEAKRKVVHT